MELFSEGKLCLRYTEASTKYTKTKYKQPYNMLSLLGRPMHIHEFQEMMKHLYFNRDSERGISGTYNWLVDEVGELGEELKGTDREAAEKEFGE